VKIREGCFVRIAENVSNSPYEPCNPRGTLLTMKPFLQTLKLLLSDLAASLLFLLLFLTTHNATLSACLGILFSLIQVASNLVRQKRTDVMQWLSLFLVVAAGVATALTDDPRFVLFKPTAIYAIIGVVMLRPGWMKRYLPAIARSVASDIAHCLGFAWAGLMFITAILNACLAMNAEFATWALTMAIFGIASKAILFIVGFAAIRLTVRFRLRAMEPDQREALLISTGWQGRSRPQTEAV
jgi:intracellular septation protein A